MKIKQYCVVGRGAQMKEKTFHVMRGGGHSMNKGQTLKGMNISNGMEWNECETEKENIFIFKETKLKRILPQWIMEGINFEEKKTKNKHPGH